jgi:hypothetical protein
MKSRLAAVIASSAAASLCLFVTSELACAAGGCARDDAAFRAEGFAVFMLLAYCIVSWVAVYPVMLVLRKRIAAAAACALVALVYAVSLSAVFHSPQVDGSFINTAKHLVPWLATAWFIGGLIATIMWPNQSYMDSPANASD